MRRTRCTIYITNIHFKFRTGSTIYCFYGRVVLFIFPPALSMNNFLNSWCAPAPFGPAGAKYFWFVYRSEKRPKPWVHLMNHEYVVSSTTFVFIRERFYVYVRVARRRVSFGTAIRLLMNDCFRQLDFGLITRDETSHKRWFIYLFINFFALCLEFLHPNGFFDYFKTNTSSIDFRHRTRYDHYRETVGVVKRLKTPKSMMFTFVLTRLNGHFVRPPTIIYGIRPVRFKRTKFHGFREYFKPRTGSRWTVT